MIEIRTEQDKDILPVRNLNYLAFGHEKEGKVIDKLRSACDEVISLVAAVENQVIGHILFSPATVEGPTGMIYGMGLAPMAVHPEHQGKGIGSQLVKAGLIHLNKTSCPFLVVLGHKEYYPHFGFIKASTLGFQCQWKGIPDKAFMAMIMDKSVMKNTHGVVKYRQEFDAAL